MTRTELMQFVSGSARSALDQRHDFDDSVASFRENLIDTMTDEGITGVEYLEALNAYDQLIATLFA